MLILVDKSKTFLPTGVDTNVQLLHSYSFVHAHGRPLTLPI